MATRLTIRRRTLVSFRKKKDSSFVTSTNRLFRINRPHYQDMATLFESLRASLLKCLSQNLNDKSSCVLLTPAVVQIQQQRVTIHNNYEETLVGILHETGSKEVVILCHGYRSCKDRIPMVNLAAAFGNEGISAFRFDFAGNGDSEGSFQYGNYYKEVDDLWAVMQHFRHEKRSVAAIIGHSKGGNVVLLYASRFKDIDAVVNISGRFDLKRGIKGRLGNDYLQRIRQHGFIDVLNKKGNIEYRVTEESLMDRLTTDTRAACQLIHKNCRVLSIHGSADKIVPKEDAMEFSKHIINHKLHIIEGADHEYTSHQNELASLVLDFVKAGPGQDKVNSPTLCTQTDKSLRSCL